MRGETAWASVRERRSSMVDLTERERRSSIYPRLEGVWAAPG